MPSRFPEVQGGGSLILAWQVKNKKVVVVGGGEVSITALTLILVTQNVNVAPKGS